MPNRIEKGIDALASGAMGLVKAAKGKLSGLSGVFTHLAREHGEVTALLLRVQASSDPELRAFLFPQIRAELLSHEKGELANVYPVFDRHPELARFTERHNADAEKLEGLIDEIAGIPYTDARWPRRFRDLVKAVNRHALEEENEMFPAASAVIDRKTTQAMLEGFEATKKRVKRELGGRTPRKAPSRKPGTVAARSADRTSSRTAPKKSAKKAAAKKAAGKKAPAKKASRAR